MHQLISILVLEISTSVFSLVYFIGCECKIDFCFNFLHSLQTLKVFVSTAQILDNLLSNDLVWYENKCFQLCIRYLFIFECIHTEIWGKSGRNQFELGGAAAISGEYQHKNLAFVSPVGIKFLCWSTTQFGLEFVTSCTIALNYSQKNVIKFIENDTSNVCTEMFSRS